jgi:hypothetical protein
LTEELEHLPAEFSRGKALAIEGKMYCGGGWPTNQVFFFDESVGKWSTLPPLPLTYFGLGQLDNQVIAVGGKRDEGATGELLVYSEGQWKQKQGLPPMPTARFFPSVISVKSLLIVGGGCVQTPFQHGSKETDTIEIYDPDGLQWYRSHPLPQPCRFVSLLASGNICYVVGGFSNNLSLNQAAYTTVDKLLNNGHAVTANDSIWKSMTNTPAYGPAATTLCGHLLSIGGHKEAGGGRHSRKDDIYMYCSWSNSWAPISHLPVPRYGIAAARLSTTEIWVIGGWGENGRLDSVVKLKMKD